MKSSNISNKIATCIATVMLLYILLVSAAQLVCFHIPGWFRYEYDKQNSVAYINGEMSLDDVVYVSDQVLYYCIGERNTLTDVKATIDGKEVNFFTERELIHLKDCRNLIMGILRIKLWALGLFVLALAFLIKRKAERKTVAKMYLLTTAVVIIGAAILVVSAINDFDAFFIKFHHLFFNNDYWILDPSKDNLINIMREGMFADSAALIAGIWAALVGIVSFIVLKFKR